MKKNVYVRRHRAAPLSPAAQVVAATLEEQQLAPVFAHAAALSCAVTTLHPA